MTSANNTIPSSAVFGSGRFGIFLSSSNGNVIYGNTFDGNNGAGASSRVDHAQAFDPGSNQWSLGRVDNQWSD